jgi:hypothetical protein
MSGGDSAVARVLSLEARHPFAVAFPLAAIFLNFPALFALQAGTRMVVHSSGAHGLWTISGDLVAIILIHSDGCVALGIRLPGGASLS